jgi:hypothetical protein
MAARDCSRALTESFETEDFAANRADEFFAGSVSGTAEQTTQDCCWSLGRDCCCHVTYSTPEVCRSRVGHAPQDIRFYLLGVIRLDAESYQALADTLVLIPVLRAKRFREGVP